jgi:iron complex transport system ATP-binding protein
MTSAEAHIRDQLSQLNPRFVMPAGPDAGDRPGWVPVTAVLDDTRPAGELIDRAVTLVAQRLQTAESWIAASILFQGWAGRLTALYAGSIALGAAVPDLSANRVKYRVCAGRVELTAAELVPVEAGTGWHQLYGNHLAPVAQALRRRVRIGRRYLDSAVAAAMAGSLTTLARAGYGPLDVLLAQPWAQPPQVRPHGRWITADGELQYARDTCCGYLRVPNGDPCRSCPLRERNPWRAP